MTFFPDKGKNSQTKCVGLGLKMNRLILSSIYLQITHGVFELYNVICLKQLLNIYYALFET